MGKPVLRPAADQLWTIIYEPCAAGEDFDFVRALDSSLDSERAGNFEAACNTRFDAFRRLVELLPDDEQVELDWNDEAAGAALTAGHRSAVDHFLTAQWEMSAAILETLLELDPEDRLESTVLLAYVYVAMEEYESFDEIADDISDREPDKAVLLLWSEFRRGGRIPAGELTAFRRRFPAWWAEFARPEHPADDAYLSDIDSGRPSDAARARELWLRTEHLWTLFPGFPEALRVCAEP